MDAPRMTAQQAYSRQGRGDPILLVDARSPSAWSHAEDKARGAVRVPPDETDSRTSVVPRSRTVVAYCT